MTDVRVALTGFGNVGQGLAELLQRDGAAFAREYGVRLVLTGVADRGGGVVSPRGLDPADLLRAKRQVGTVAAAAGGVTGLAGEQFLESADAQVLVEAASTNFEDAEPGWSYVRMALGKGMDIVLASKGALVLHFDEMMSQARQYAVHVLYTATVGAPLPVLELPERVLVDVHIDGFEGIVNATTNQILTSMEEGATYEEGVRAAQEIGVAETDPTLDVEGWDAAAKAVIIARSLFGGSVSLEDVDRTGIRGVTRDELVAARERGGAIRLIARVERWENGVRASVGPEERPRQDPLGGIRGQQMGLIFKTEELGDVSCTVQLTGGVPTALAVLRDIVNLARDRGWIAQQ